MKYLRRINENSIVPVDMDHDIEEFYKVVKEQSVSYNHTKWYIEYTDELINEYPTMIGSEDLTYYQLFSTDYDNRSSELIMIVRAVNENHAVLLVSTILNNTTIFLDWVEDPEGDLYQIEESNLKKVKELFGDFEKDEIILKRKMEYLKGL